jgi:hypothetical protein
MLVSARTADERIHRRHPTSAPSLGLDADLLQLADHLRGERVLIIGAGALELLCAVLRRGAKEASLMRLGTRPEEHSADLAIVTEGGRGDRALAAITSAERALTCAGRIILHLGADPAQPLSNMIVRTLRMHGFSAVRVHHLGNQAVVTGSLSSPALPAYVRKIARP